MPRNPPLPPFKLPRTIPWLPDKTVEAVVDSLREAIVVGARRALSGLNIADLVVAAAQPRPGAEGALMSHSFQLSVPSAGVLGDVTTQDHIIRVREERSYLYANVWATSTTGGGFGFADLQNMEFHVRFNDMDWIEYPDDGGGVSTSTQRAHGLLQSATYAGSAGSNNLSVCHSVFPLLHSTTGSGILQTAIRKIFALPLAWSVCGELYYLRTSR